MVYVSHINYEFNIMFYMCWVNTHDKLLQNFNSELPSDNLLHSYFVNGPVEIVDFPINNMVIFHL